MEINGKIVVNKGTKAKENVKSNLLQVNGNVGVLGNSIFNNNLLVNGNNGLSGVSLLPSGLQVFSNEMLSLILRPNMNRVNNHKTQISCAFYKWATNLLCRSIMVKLLSTERDMLASVLYSYTYIACGWPDTFKYVHHCNKHPIFD